MELKSYQAYRNPELEIRYWRTSSGFEADFILGDMEAAVEIKGTRRVHSGHVKGLKTLLEEQPVGKAMIVSMEEQPRNLDGISILPWQNFIEALWSGELV